MEIKEMSRKSLVKGDPIIYEERLKKLRKEGEKLIKGIFEFVDAQGGWLEFTNRTFPGTPITYYRISHGEIVELPKYIINSLRGAKKKVRKFASDLTTTRGVPSTYELISRINFTPVDL